MRPKFICKIKFKGPSFLPIIYIRDDAIGRLELKSFNSIILKMVLEASFELFIFKI